MKRSTEWGHPQRYYSDSDASVENRRRSETEKRIEGILQDHNAELPDRVERAFKQWNHVLRDYLRNEMALRLSVGEDTCSVPVRVVPGLPPPLQHILRGKEDQIRFLLNRPLIEQTGVGLHFVKKQYSDLAKQIPGIKERATAQDLQKACGYIDYLSNFLASMDLIEEIGKIEEDTLGAYFFNTPKIELYWAAIGLEAAILNVSPEALTIVTAAHELAHAYSHMGRDIDGGRWETSNFATTDDGIIEGLAQFYTKVMCQRLEQRMPEAKEAYLKFLDRQRGPYHAHLSWAAENEPAGEIVRVSMIQARSQGIRFYEDFSEILKKQRLALKRRQNSQQDDLFN